MKTRILVTIGDINGIGPEIILKTLKNGSFIKKYDITVVSPIYVLSYYAKLLKIKLSMDNFNIIPIATEKFNINIGRITEESGYISGLAIDTAIQLALSGEYDAIVTAPINKKSLNMGGYNFTGHTEMLTSIGGAKNTCMIMLSDIFNIAFVTTHPPLKNVSSLITKKLLMSKIEVCYNMLKNDLGIRKPKMGVLGLNPHAGDNGFIGDEERKTILPAVNDAMLKYNDMFISEPQSADGYFSSKKYLKYDITLAMYHDQGFIPFKMLAGHKGTNYTAGLSFIRTSPDHGTAFDIAGKNKASEVSLVDAIKWADKLSRNRKLKTKP
jgi:4-hydroxythreonine-4-phosphate dehydrogenase